MAVRGTRTAQLGAAVWDAWAQPASPVLSSQRAAGIDWSSLCCLREGATAAVTSMELSPFGGSPAVEMMDFVFHPFTQNDLLF